MKKLVKVALGAVAFLGIIQNGVTGKMKKAPATIVYGSEREL